jgi:hypothetical protein
MVTGMDASQPAGLCICEGCVIGRQTERPHKGTLRQGQYPMDVVHTDIAGPFDASFNQSKYWITHLCGWSGYAEATPLQNKDEAFGITRNFIDRHERPERRCRLIIQDRGGENLDENYITWAYDRAIELQYSDTDQHQACGKAERLNRTIKDKLQPSLVASGLDPRHWSEVVENYIIHVRNYSPCTDHNATPWELFMGTRPNISHLRTLGSKVYVLKTPTQRKNIINGASGRKVVGQKAYIGRLLGFRGRVTVRVAPDHNPSKAEWRTNVAIRERRPCTSPEQPEPGRQDDGELANQYDTDDDEVPPSTSPAIQTDSTVRRPTPPPPPPPRRQRFDYKVAPAKEGWL